MDSLALSMTAIASLGSTLATLASSLRAAFCVGELYDDDVHCAKNTLLNKGVYSDAKDCRPSTLEAKNGLQAKSV